MLDTVAQPHDPMHAPLASSASPASALGCRPIPLIDSADLLHGHRELIIEHTGLRYHLQVTRNGKLILTK